MPQFRFPGLVPGDRWCVTAANWLRAHRDGAAAYVVRASTHERALELVALEALEHHAVDVPEGPGLLSEARALPLPSRLGPPASDRTDKRTRPGGTDEAPEG